MRELASWTSGTRLCWSTVVGGPVVLRRVDHFHLKGIAHIAVGEGHGLRAQECHHVHDQLGVLDPDRQARHVRRGMDGMGVGIEAPGTGIVPAQAHQSRLIEDRQKFFADLAVQDAPHVVRILVEEGQLQDVELGDLVGELRQGHPGEVDAAEGHLLQDLGLGAVLAVVFNLDDHRATRGLPDQLRETQSSLDR